MPTNGNARENITPEQSSRDSHAAVIPQAVTPRTRRAGRSGTRRARGFGGRGAPASGFARKLGRVALLGNSPTYGGCGDSLCGVSCTEYRHSRSRPPLRVACTVISGRGDYALIWTQQVLWPVQGVPREPNANAARSTARRALRGAKAVNPIGLIAFALLSARSR